MLKNKWQPISMRRIRAFANQITEQFHPERIILFGSYANGRPTEESDVDLLIVMNTRLREVDKAAEIRCGLDAPFPLDLLVRRPGTIQKRIAQGDCFLQDAFENGKTLLRIAAIIVKGAKNHDPIHSSNC